MIHATLRNCAATCSFLFALLLLCSAWPQAAAAQTPPDGNVCFLVADDKDPGGKDLERRPDELTQIDRQTGAETALGLTGTERIEAIAYQQSTNTLFATDVGQFGTLDQETGAFTPHRFRLRGGSGQHRPRHVC